LEALPHLVQQRRDGGQCQRPVDAMTPPGRVDRRADRGAIAASSSRQQVR
jgi:hypothetical protein